MHLRYLLLPPLVFPRVLVFLEHSHTRQYGGDVGKRWSASRPGNDELTTRSARSSHWWLATPKDGHAGSELRGGEALLLDLQRHNKGTSQKIEAFVLSGI